MSEKHKIRLSIDIHAIKNNNFTGNVYIRYKQNTSLSKKRKFKAV